MEKLIEILSLIAGLMTMTAPAMQAIKTIRTRDVTGLSAASYILLLCLGVFAVLIGVQYRVATMTALNFMGAMFNVIIMYLISRRALAGFAAGLAILVGGAALIAPWFLEGLITTRWAEPVAFVYGLVASATFLPQVILTHKTKAVSALALSNLLLMVCGMVIWIVVSVLLGNWSLIGWNSILLLMLAELLRLKLTIEHRQKVAATTPAA